MFRENGNNRNIRRIRIMADLTTSKGRVQNEFEELKERNEKLGNLLGKIKSDNWESHKKLLEKMSDEHKKLLRKQYYVQKTYIRILEKRLKIWKEE